MRTPEAHEAALKQFRTFVGGTQFVPGVLDKPTLEFPGVGGGAEWGGSAVDPKTGVIYINANQVAFTTTLVRNDPSAGIGARTYQSQCAVCHGATRTGAPPAYPSLVDIFSRQTAAQIADTIHRGRGRMSSFPNIEGPKLDALLEYLRTGKDTGRAGSVASDAAGSAAVICRLRRGPVQVRPIPPLLRGPRSTKRAVRCATALRGKGTRLRFHR